MTVKELIDILKEFDPNTRVATRRYSELRYMTPEDVSASHVFDSRGYLSHIYREQDKPLGFEVVYFEGN
jgi:hypothetical protein